MAGTVVVNSGYRLRDLIAGGAVVQMSVAFVQALQFSDFGPDLRTPAILFIGSILLLVSAYGAGAVVDKLAERFPSLIRRRRCPKLLLLTIFVTTTVIALTQEAVAGTLINGGQTVAMEVGSMFQQLFATVK